MREALGQLVMDTERYTLLIKLPRTNWRTGKSQDTDLTLFESDGIDLVTTIDTRLLTLTSRYWAILSDRVNGTVQINLSKRTWSIIQDSPAVRDKLINFNSKLIQGKRGRFIGPGWASSRAPHALSGQKFYGVHNMESGGQTRASIGFLSKNFTPNGGPKAPHWLNGILRCSICALAFFYLL